MASELGICESLYPDLERQGSLSAIDLSKLAKLTGYEILWFYGRPMTSTPPPAVL